MKLPKKKKKIPGYADGTPSAYSSMTPEQQQTYDKLPTDEAKRDYIFQLANTGNQPSGTNNNNAATAATITAAGKVAASSINQSNVQSGKVDPNVTAEHAGQSTYDTADSVLSTVGSAVPVVGVISAGVDLGNSIGEPIRQDAEQTDKYGNLVDEGQAKESAVSGSLFDPFKAMTTRLSYKGGLTDLSGDAYAADLERKAKKKVQPAMAADMEAHKWQADYQPGTGMSDGGQVKGKGSAKSDSIPAKIDGDGFVVPEENAAIAMVIRHKFLGDSPTAKADLKAGDSKVKLSNGEHYFTGPEAALLQAKGINLGALAPNAKPEHKLNAGGSVDEMEIPEKKQKNPGMLAHGGSPIPIRVALSNKNRKVPGMKKGGTPGYADGGKGPLKPEELDLSDPNVQKYIKAIIDLEANVKDPIGGKTTIDANKDGKADSTAQGQFQFVKGTRDRILKASGYDAWSKDPVEQQKAAVALIKERGALDHIKKGDFKKADDILKTEWPSLPGGSQQSKKLPSVLKARDEGVQAATPAAKPEFPKQYSTTPLLKHEQKDIETLKKMGADDKTLYEYAYEVKKNRYKKGDSATMGTYTWGGQEYHRSPRQVYEEFKTKVEANPKKYPVGDYNPYPYKNDAEAAVANTSNTPKVSDWNDEEGSGIPTITETEMNMMDDVNADKRIQGGLSGKVTNADGSEVTGVPDQLEKRADPVTAAKAPAPEKEKNFLSDVDKILAAGQVGLGAYQLSQIGARPVDQLNSQEVADVGQAVDNARYGLSPLELSKVEADLELNRRNTNASIISQSGGDAGTALANMKVAQLTKNQGLVDLGIENQNVMQQKQRYRDSVVSNLAEKNRRLFDDKMHAFDQNEAAAGDLMNAGISNLVGSFKEDKWLQQLDKM